MLNIQNLTTSYGQIKAIRGITLEVPEGKIVSLIGANGAGKTTTMRTIAGQLKPEAGTITFCGQRIEGSRPHQIVKAGLALVPEGRAILGKMTVLENLEMGAFQRNDAQGIKEDMEKMMTWFPILKERLSQLGGTMSGGQQQMLAIARALMSRPKLLLLDEPSMGLAPIVVADIFKVIKEINAEGTTVLIVEQNVKQALKIADYGYVLEAGQIVLDGTGESLLNDERVKEAYLGGRKH
ncbi:MULTISPECIES: ABC transporter ATP-binding protein [Brevibacillus]|uniref:ABC transporter ATP-binding protein n=1 Tax=Brevibacillus TaxID=55080 RepID=UPI000D11131F|nr:MULTISPECIES: ABC transporter ATP-binding protein [Brevibacillus]PSJ64666.1 ABC transporter ATP-binding protein [Brevibacillus brevis]RED32845.1 branched-chain amino acid transport system ATP-binding protein [Brevibacillus brevis]TQK73769.1 branched-chain amino acid transport system ATP-binding protein [Brevibacillus sp. AG162]VEF90518.1 LIV-I protein F [Brevibacillus brevis]GEC91181.1 ABC transporter ATP-binding protein [Brevibacillus brevis]